MSLVCVFPHDVAYEPNTRAQRLGENVKALARHFEEASLNSPPPFYGGGEGGSFSEGAWIRLSGVYVRTTMVVQQLAQLGGLAIQESSRLCQRVPALIELASRSRLAGYPKPGTRGNTRSFSRHRRLSRAQFPPTAFASSRPRWRRTASSRASSIAWMTLPRSAHVSSLMKMPVSWLSGFNSPCSNSDHISAA